MSFIALKIAFRELKGSFKSFWIYLACLALGTAAIAASGAITEGFVRGLDQQSRSMLGGDALFSTNQRRASDEERAFIESLGRVTETAGLDMMAQSPRHRTQVNIRAIDNAFPVIGKAQLSGGADTLQDAVAQKDGQWGAAVSASFLDSFKLKIGDKVKIGQVDVLIRARLDGWPDRLGTPGAFGPEAVIHLDSLIAIGRMDQGRLFNSGIRVAFDTPKDFETLQSHVDDNFKDQGLRLRKPEDAVDGLRELLQTLNNFLAVIGFAALLAGGVGVAQASRSFLDSRIPSIAALKALGADGQLIRRIYSLQFGILAVIGTSMGVLIGGAAPFLMNALARDIPLPQVIGFYPKPLLIAFTLGILTAIIFALPAIGRARDTQPSQLFRRLSGSKHQKTPPFEKVGASLAAIALTALVVITSSRPGMTLALLAGALITWGVCRISAWGIRKIAARLVKKSKGLWRLSLSNLAGPGSLAPTIIPAIGLGLALLVLVTTIQTNLIRQIRDTAPANAPSLVFSQIPSDNIDKFDQILSQNGLDISSLDSYRRAPFLLGRVITLKDKPLIVEDVAPSERWVVNGETSLTYLPRRPPEAVLTKGEWWPDDYDGPLLVSIEEDAARGLNLDVGDNIGFRIFGREVTAKVASLRKIDWGTFSIASNTAFILSPGTLEAAKPYHVAIAKTQLGDEAKIIEALAEPLPDVIIFQTRPALETAVRLFGNIAIAINAAASIVSISALFVLLGAFAASARQRRSETALLKTFGASGTEILSLYAREFMMAAGFGAVIGTGFGIAAAYPVVTQVFEAQWFFPLKNTFITIALALLVAAMGGMAVGLATLKQPPMRVLRSGEI